METKPKVIAVVGPTASGKTSLSIKIAKEFDGEVISADSRQVYRGMDIGTGKVTKEEMDDVPHHLLDIADPMSIYTAANFEHDATAALEGILKRGHLPIIAGGSTFYIDLLLGRQQSAPVPPNASFRAELEQYSNSELFEKLKAADPRRAETIDPDNRRRLERALEIIDTLGLVPEPTIVGSSYNWLLVGVDITKEQLHKNIHIRLLERIEMGMVEEAKKLHEEGVTYERMNDLGLEYRYLAKFLQNELTEEEMIEELEIKIRQYAKRQMTWLKSNSDIEWFAPEDSKAVFRRVKDFLSE